MQGAPGSTSWPQNAVDYQQSAAYGQPQAYSYGHAPQPMPGASHGYPGPPPGAYPPSYSPAHMVGMVAHPGGYAMPHAQMGPAAQPRPKRRRITPEQLEVLVAVFAEQDTPGYETREKLSMQLNMTVREVQVWFQNRRAKVNRERLQAQQQAQIEMQRMQLEEAKASLEAHQRRSPATASDHNATHSGPRPDVSPVPSASSEPTPTISPMANSPTRLKKPSPPKRAASTGSRPPSRASEPSGPPTPATVQPAALPPAGYYSYTPAPGQPVMDPNYGARHQYYYSAAPPPQGPMYMMPHSIPPRDDAHGPSPTSASSSGSMIYPYANQAYPSPYPMHQPQQWPQQPNAYMQASPYQSGAPLPPTYPSGAVPAATYPPAVPQSASNQPGAPPTSAHHGGGQRPTYAGAYEEAMSTRGTTHAQAAAYAQALQPVQASNGQNLTLPPLWSLGLRGSQPGVPQRVPSPYGGSSNGGDLPRSRSSSGSVAGLQRAASSPSHTGATGASTATTANSQAPPSPTVKQETD